MMTGSSSTPIDQNQKLIKQEPTQFTPPISAAINGKYGIQVQNTKFLMQNYLLLKK